MNKQEESVNEDEGDGQDVVSMEDVIKQEEQLEADANAVLGDSDDKNCTYPSGYVTRQALYACNSCRPGDQDSGAICLACSFACHEGHDLIELYTKRNFRCDCGNNKFPGKTCILHEFKDDENSDNIYNHNFRGLYCTCSRPYPDPDDSVEDEMIQCIVCEDWYHTRHLGADRPHNDNFEEVICSGCMVKHKWLWAYITQSKVVNIKDADNSVLIDPCETETKTDTTTPTQQPTGETGTENTTETPQQSRHIKDNVNNDNSESVCCLDKQETFDTKRDENGQTSCDTGVCLLRELQTREISEGSGGAYLSDGWRNKLCRCQLCVERYTREGVAFLTDPHDSVKSYENRGHKSQTPEARLQRGMTALQNVDRVVLGEVMHGYNDLKENLKDYLKKFVDNGKVVREEDIREFFEGMEQRKKRRLEYVPRSSCR